MTEWFVEVLNKKDNWVRWDGIPYDGYGTATIALFREGLTDKNCWYRIVPKWNDTKHLLKTH